MGKVFLVQRPSVKVNGRWTDKYDLSAAREFGELAECLPPGNIPRELSGTAARLRQALGAFDSEQDYLLAIGDPIAISMAVLIADRASGGGVRVLKWDRRAERYVPFKLPEV